MTPEAILKRFNGVKKTGSGYMAICPAHDDTRQSLNIRQKGDKILVHCFAGCKTEDVLRAVGLELSDLYISNNGAYKSHRGKLKKIIATYDYTDENGKLLYQIVRYEPKDFRPRRPDGNGGWIWNLKGVRRVPYQLPALLASDSIYLVEGEKDVQTLEKHGEIATCFQSGVNGWRNEFKSYFNGKVVKIIPDNDGPGLEFADKVAAALHGTADEIVVISLPGLRDKGDVSDFFENGGTVDDLIGLLERAEPWSKTDQTESLTRYSGFPSLLETKPVDDWIKGAMVRPIPRKLFGEFWYESELCFLFADTGLGKSTLAVQVAQSIASGVQIQPFDLEAESQRVLYLDFELSDKQFELRYSESPRGSLTTVNHFQFSDNFFRSEINSDCELPEGFGDFNEYLFECIEQALDSTKATVLIVDNITYLRDELERSKDALPLMKRLKKLKQARGLSVLVLAHTPKRDIRRPIIRNDLSGSKMIINFTDSCFAIGESHTETGIRYLKQIKVRNASMRHGETNVCTFSLEKPSNFLSFHFKDYDSEFVHLRTVDGTDKEEKRRMAKELSEKGLTQREIANELGVSVGTVNNYLKT